MASMKAKPGEAIVWSLWETNSATILNLIPEDFLKSHPFIHESLAKFDKTASEYDKLQIIDKLQSFMNSIRYDEDHIYDQDDPALLPERIWLYDVVQEIENTRKELFWELYGDLAE